jgi:hypothetical protein
MHPRPAHSGASQAGTVGCASQSSAHATMELRRRLPCTSSPGVGGLLKWSQIVPSLAIFCMLQAFRSVWQQSALGVINTSQLAQNLPPEVCVCAVPENGMPFHCYPPLPGPQPVVPFPWPALSQTRASPGYHEIAHMCHAGQTSAADTVTSILCCWPGADGSAERPPILDSNQVGPLPHLSPFVEQSLSKVDTQAPAE